MARQLSPDGADRAESAIGNLILAIEGHASTAEEAIRVCGRALEGAGSVRPGFAASCVDREFDYPTGLATEVPVALPHCQSNDILRSTLCYLRLDEPVEFRRMDDDEDSIWTRHVFNLAILPGNHLAFLTSTISMLQDARVLKNLENMDIGEVPGFLHDQLDR